MTGLILYIIFHAIALALLGLSVRLVGDSRETFKTFNFRYFITFLNGSVEKHDSNEEVPNALEANVLAFILEKLPHGFDIDNFILEFLNEDEKTFNVETSKLDFSKTTKLLLIVL